MFPTFKAWYNALQTREQLFLSVGFPVILVMMIYLFFWEPTVEQRAVLERELQTQQNLNRWLNEQAELYASSLKTIKLNENLATLVETSLQEASLSSYSIRLFKDSQSNTVLQLGRIPYTQFNAWLLDLQEQNSIFLIDATIQALDTAGYVDVKLVLSDTPK